MSEVTVHRSDQRMDEIMGGLLRTGVVLAAAIVLVGGVRVFDAAPGAGDELWGVSGGAWGLAERFGDFP